MTTHLNTARNMKTGTRYLERAMSMFYASVQNAASNVASWLSSLLRTRQRSTAFNPEPPLETTVKRSRYNPRLAYGYQPAAGVTNGTVKYAKAYGDKVVLETSFHLANNKVKMGVFEVPVKDFWHLRRDARFKFDDAAELVGRRIELHVSHRTTFQRMKRASVTTVKVLKTPPLPIKA